ncbi:MAG: hypothetical protein ACXVEC_00525 [Nocardioides sp.]
MRRVPGPRAVARRAVAGVGLDEVIRLARRVDSLAVAVTENAALAVPLEARVAELEQALVGPLEHRRDFLAPRRPSA